MLLLNYDFYDIHCVLTILREKPEKAYNTNVLKSIFEILSAPQTDNNINDNIIRKKLRSVENIDKDDFYWIYADNIYTYGCEIIKNKGYYSLLATGFQMMLEYAKSGDFNRLQDLADALHNIPVFFADGCKNLKKALKIQFADYNKTYATNLLKELSK